MQQERDEPNDYSYLLADNNNNHEQEIVDYSMQANRLVAARSVLRDDTTLQSANRVSLTQQRQQQQQQEIHRRVSPYRSNTYLDYETPTEQYPSALVSLEKEGRDLTLNRRKVFPLPTQQQYNDDQSESEYARGGGDGRNLTHHQQHQPFDPTNIGYGIVLSEDEASIPPHHHHQQQAAEDNLSVATSLSINTKDEDIVGRGGGEREDEDDGSSMASSALPDPSLLYHRTRMEALQFVLEDQSVASRTDSMDLKEGMRTTNHTWSSTSSSSPSTSVESSRPGRWGESDDDNTKTNQPPDGSSSSGGTGSLSSSSSSSTTTRARWQRARLTAPPPPRRRNRDEESPSRPGAYSVSGDGYRVLPPGRHLVGTTSSMDEDCSTLDADCDVEMSSQISNNRRYGNSSSNDKGSKLKRRCLVLLLLPLVVGIALMAIAIAILVWFFVMQLNNNNGHDDAAEPPVVVVEDTPCTLNEIYRQCRQSGVLAFNATDASCARAKYNLLQTQWVANGGLPYDDMDQPLDSCNPSNLALWSLAETLVNDPPSIVTDTWLLGRYSLGALYFATGGHEWYKSDRWLSNSSVCAWRGISCHDESTTRISEIDLYLNNLKGTIPSELALLTTLREFSLFMFFVCVFVFSLLTQFVV